jgi:3-methyladenine DNA glycosylase/8-oxoguanine DNA glycosylase
VNTPAAIARARDEATEDEMLQVAERWRPYRSLAVSYLFGSEFEKGT